MINSKKEGAKKPSNLKMIILLLTLEIYIFYMKFTKDLQKAKYLPINEEILKWMVKNQCLQGTHFSSKDYIKQF